MENQFSRTQRVLGEEGLNKLNNSRVAVFGIGGVGGYAVEALVRSGIGTIDIVDNDEVSLSNINRQIIALNSTVGLKKTKVMEKRIHDINPNCTVICHECFYLSEETDGFEFDKYDYVIDAIDTLAGKIAIIKACEKVGIPVISCMSTGNKLNPMAFEVSDIYDTKICPIAKVMRKLCRENNIKELKVVYSREKPLKEEREDKTKRLPPSSIAFVPPVAGMIMAGEVIKDITGIKGNGIDRS